MKKRGKRSRVLIIIGSILLLAMAIFHGSGIAYVTELMNQSDAKTFLKEIFPVLFASASIKLIAFSILGFITLKNIEGMKKILLVIFAFVTVDSLTAFYLEAWVPGVLLLIAAWCFLSPVVSREK